MFALFYKQAIAAGLACLLIATPASAAGKTITVVALGDSLTAGYMLGPDDGFVPQLQKALKARGHDNVAIADAGVSGDTSAAGLSRLDWAVGPEADGVILELGANDALRGLDPKLTQRNLETIVSRLEARHLPILFAGMLAPPNMGADYGKRFNVIYRALAARHRVVFYPFFLDGVATQPKLTLEDGMHPSKEGVAVIVARILPKVEELIGRIETAKAAAK